MYLLLLFHNFLAIKTECRVLGTSRKQPQESLQHDHSQKFVSGYQDIDSQETRGPWNSLPNYGRGSRPM